MVTVNALGMAPQKITARRGAEGKPIIVDVTLKRASVQLEAVRVTETRRRPPPREQTGIPQEQSASERGTGNAPGAPSRRSTERSADWQPLRPKLVVEVRYDHVTASRFRHGTRLVRWRPDKAPSQCTFTQLKP